MLVRSDFVATFRTYGSQADQMVKDYVLADPWLPYTSILSGILMSKLAYDLTQLVSSIYCKCYSSLTMIQRMEWNNRGMSSIHAIFVTAIAVYLVVFSNLFFGTKTEQLIVFRNSHLSVFGLGISVGYFMVDLAMIIWMYPSLGGMEFVVHHGLSVIAVAYTMFSGEGHLYTYMILISEATTPAINIRWFLDTAGMKRSNVYLFNGIMVFLLWLFVRILLFIFLFYLVYLHHEQIKKMHIFGYLLVFVVPIALAIMNLLWFAKIIKGVMKTVAKNHSKV